MNKSGRRRVLGGFLAAILTISAAPLTVSADAGDNPQPNSWRYGEEASGEQLNRAYTASANLKKEDFGALRKGIDVSYAQGKIDWAKVKASGIEFAILRLCYGYHYGYDEQFKYNASECERLGIPYGVYVYSYTETAKETQLEAENALNLLEGYSPSYPVYFDLEDSIVLNAAKKTGNASKWISEQAVSFCQIMEDNGYTPGIYANLNWFNNYLNSTTVDKYEKWVAQYNLECQYKKPYAMWQYSSAGSVDGIKGDVDLNFDFKERTDEPVFRYERFAGASRYKTATAIANGLLKIQGKSKFDNIVVASGENYPDALTGCYLASAYNAPVLMVNKANETYVADYIKGKLNSGGKIFILGDKKVVSSALETKLKAYGNVQRLAGATRYDTNLDILKAAPNAKELVVCSGEGYADSLSASSCGRPMMIVGASLTSKQKEYLKTAGYEKIYIIGGVSAVSSAVEIDLPMYATSDVIRISGGTRYETSRLVAEAFFKDPAVAAFTIGDNFPDGIAGGSLANACGAPVLLVNKDNNVQAKLYTQVKTSIRRAMIYGDASVVSKAIIEKLFEN
ncbi:MAG: cell wall-binding repeat-containing protein [Firmicutes bacterium]|nr:cell wall-binding repeat-containing protein [Bacillota bacterium]